MANILIIERNATIQSYLTAQLKKSGHSVDVVGDALRAWKAVWHGGYDVLFISITLPEMDGFSLAQKALLEMPDVQIVFITGFSGVSMDTQATPPYAPAPLTLDSFHLRHAASYVRYLMGYGPSPLPVVDAPPADNVIYADFSGKQVSSSRCFLA